MTDEYGFFIWSAYGVTGLTIVALLVWAVLDHRAQVRALARLGASEDKRVPETARAAAPSFRPASHA